MTTKKNDTKPTPREVAAAAMAEWNLAKAKLTEARARDSNVALFDFIQDPQARASAMAARRVALECEDAVDVAAIRVSAAVDTLGAKGEVDADEVEVARLASLGPLRDDLVSSLAEEARLRHELEQCVANRKERQRAAIAAHTSLTEKRSRKDLPAPLPMPTGIPNGGDWMALGLGDTTEEQIAQIAAILADPLTLVVRKNMNAIEGLRSDELTLRANLERKGKADAWEEEQSKVRRAENEKEYADNQAARVAQIAHDQKEAEAFAIEKRKLAEANRARAGA